LSAKRRTSTTSGTTQLEAAPACNERHLPFKLKGLCYSILKATDNKTEKEAAIQNEKQLSFKIKRRCHAK
jgi:hypothetical protein